MDGIKTRCACCNRQRVKVLNLVSSLGEWFVCKKCALAWGCSNEAWDRAWKAKMQKP